MLHQDGSRHEWVAGESWDLIVILDDATSEIYSAFFVAEEGTRSTFRALGEVITGHGLFCALYADRGSPRLTHRAVRRFSRQLASLSSRGCSP